jgi:hypothetical protein
MSSRKSVRILSICDDEGIRISRELVLRQEGYEVESITSSTVWDPRLAVCFHVAVLCHTLAPSEAANWAMLLRQENPGIRVLRVYCIRSRSENLYDVDCEVLSGPAALLAAIQTLLPTQAPPAAIHERRHA